MELQGYVERLRHELAVAAETGGEEARVLAERLSAPLESAVRLVLLEALSTAAGEITRELAPGSVELRLRDRDPDFVVTPSPAEETVEASATELAVPEADESGPMVRINFRMPEHLKSRIEHAAAREGFSVNAWLGRVAAAAAAGSSDAAAGGRRTPRAGQRYTGWVR